MSSSFQGSVNPPSQKFTNWDLGRKSQAVVWNLPESLPAYWTMFRCLMGCISSVFTVPSVNGSFYFAWAILSIWSATVVNWFYWLIELPHRVHINIEPSTRMHRRHSAFRINSEIKKPASSGQLASCSRRTDCNKNAMIVEQGAWKGQQKQLTRNCQEPGILSGKLNEPPNVCFSIFNWILKKIQCFGPWDSAQHLPALTKNHSERSLCLSLRYPSVFLGFHQFLSTTKWPQIRHFGTRIWLSISTV